MHDLRYRRLQSEIAAVPVHTGVIGEAPGVTAEAQLIIGLVEVAGAEDEFGLTVALESGAGHNVEDAIRAVAKFGAVATAADFQIVDVFGIELRAEVGSDVGIGHGDAVEQPAGLMSAANVKLVVCNVGSRHEVRDHSQAVGAGSTWSARDLDAIDERGRGGGVGW